jgi:hypothetical protein
MRAEIEELRTAMKTIQAAKCSICHGQLDLPTGTALLSHCLKAVCYFISVSYLLYVRLTLLPRSAFPLLPQLPYALSAGVGR